MHSVFYPTNVLCACTSFAIVVAQLIHARIIFDPRKTLDVLEAQKKLVYTYVTVCDMVDIARVTGMPFVESLDERRKLLETVVKRFAAVYSEHPDYNQKWAINE